MEFDYKRDTKEHHKNEETAKDYHQAFTENVHRKSMRHRSVAACESAVVLPFLELIAHNTVLDIPTETGKRAPISNSLKANVTACDISEQMMSIARLEDQKAGVNDARFQVCNAEAIANALGEHFDMAVCLQNCN